ncbi:hypothetical protein HPG02_00465 [Pediococcus pentosaceus]|uniref:hypothetical protein n=1 Tax=Pediococcus pentosaceus TaxID=1255 RepID=UPI001C1EBA3A|nr:hypothetical protein [Pediococcus pentosaceus]MBU7002110.1 hypothetical protein [Pediococcus pentosaceus]MCG9227398.1 hypothetical protein [Pediococcus pentosaceus]MDA8037465.1 hypothetical protein [Pediococcus pentosaceus]
MILDKIEQELYGNSNNLSENDLLEIKVIINELIQEKKANKWKKSELSKEK